MKEELEFFDPETIDWEPVAGMAGMEQKILSGSKDSPDHSRLARVAAGSTYDVALAHDFWEEIWIVEGSIRDRSTGEVYSAGMYACRPPGMSHGPFEFSEDAVFFEVRYRDR
jgi:hypothetical protein